MPTAEATHPRLLSNLPFSSFERCIGRPIYLPGSKDQTANLSIERMAWLVISARSVAFHARIKMQSRPSPLSRSTIPPTDRATPSSFTIAICRVTFAFSLRLRVVDKWMRGREGIVLPALPILVAPRSNIDARDGRRIRTWNLVRCFRWGRGDTLPSNNSSTASRLFTIDGIISSALKRAGGSVEQFYLFFFLRVLIYSFSLSLCFFSRDKSNGIFIPSLVTIYSFM